MKRILLIAAILTGIFLYATGAFAYFTDEGIAQNGVDIGSVTTEIVENFEDPGLPQPGDVITKEVRIRSTGESECFVRVQVLFSDGQMEENCSLNYNTEDWEYKNGWWYYHTSLQTGDLTSPLFTSIQIREDAQEIKAFDLFVRQESRQASSNSAEKWR